jgi:hypothetical protein
MADSYLDLSLDSQNLKIKLIDQGDGTYSLGTELTAGDINIGNVDIDNIYTPDTFKDQATAAIGTIATVWTPASGKKIRIMGGSISVSAAVSVLFEDNSAGAANFVWRTPKLLADTPYFFDLGNGKLLSAVNNVLKATSSGAANLTGTLYGLEE